MISEERRRELFTAFTVAYLASDTRLAIRWFLGANWDITPAADTLTEEKPVRELDSTTGEV